MRLVVMGILGILVWTVLSVLAGLWVGRALKASRDYREQMDKVWPDRPEQTAWLEYQDRKVRQDRQDRKARQEAKAHREAWDR